MNDNLIFNGDFSKGTTGWSGNNLTVSNGEATVTGSLVASDQYKFPVYLNIPYTLSFDIRYNIIASANQYFYICFYPYDKNREFIGPAQVQKISNTNTTLAAPLNNGDATATLTSGAGWIKDTTYRRLGICDTEFGYKRSTKSQTISAVNGNTITLSSAWNLGFFPAGTMVAEFTDGSSYEYPWAENLSGKPTGQWKTITVSNYVFRDTEGNRNCCARYIKLGTLGYTHNYSIRNLKLVNNYGIQKNEFDLNSEFKINKNGVINSGNFREIEIPKTMVYNTSVIEANEFYEI